MQLTVIRVKYVGDLTKHAQRMKVAQGGFHGLGNARFKTSQLIARHDKNLTVHRVRSET